MTTKGFSPEEILSGINKKLKSMLPVGMFFGAQLVVVNHDLEHVRVYNAGMPDVVIVDGISNRIKHRMASNGLPLGVEAEIDPRSMVQYAPISLNDRILMYSDGLTEARNASDQVFGNERLTESISRAPADGIFDHLIADLDRFCGPRTTQADDVTLVEISCVHDVLPEIETQLAGAQASRRSGNRGEWKLSLRFDGARLRETNPVPILVSYLMEIEQLEEQRKALFTVLTELYINALDHGVLGLDSSLKSDPSGFEKYFRTREKRLAKLERGYVIFDLTVEQESGRRSILLRVEDSGKGFDYDEHTLITNWQMALSGRGIFLIQDLCDYLEYEGDGNIAVARLSWSTA